MLLKIFEVILFLGWFANRSLAAAGGPSAVHVPVLGILDWRQSASRASLLPRAIDPHFGPCSTTRPTDNLPGKKISQRLLVLALDALYDPSSGAASRTYQIRNRWLNARSASKFQPISSDRSQRSPLRRRLRNWRNRWSRRRDGGTTQCASPADLSFAPIPQPHSILCRHATLDGSHSEHPALSRGAMFLEWPC